jgi:hypothetical protein
MTPAEASRQKKKTKIWTTHNILGVMLSLLAAGGVIELRPQFTVEPQAELKTSEPFSVPFQITNTGYLAINASFVLFYIHDLQFAGDDIKDNIVWSRDWENFIIEEEDSKTITCSVTKGGPPPTRADVVVAVGYTYLGVKWTRYFRFVGTHMDNWKWLPEPHDDITADIDRAVDRAQRMHD